MNNESSVDAHSLAILLDGNRLLGELTTKKEGVIERGEALSHVRALVAAKNHFLPTIGDETPAKRRQLSDAMHADPAVREARRRLVEANVAVEALKYIRLECQRMIASIVQEQLFIELKTLHPTLSPKVAAGIQIEQSMGYDIPVLTVEVSFARGCDACTLQSVATYVQSFIIKQIGSAIELSVFSLGIENGKSARISFQLN